MKFRWIDIKPKGFLTKSIHVHTDGNEFSYIEGITHKQCVKCAMKSNHKHEFVQINQLPEHVLSRRWMVTADPFSLTRKACKICGEVK